MKKECPLPWPSLSNGEGVCSKRRRFSVIPTTSGKRSRSNIESVTLHGNSIEILLRRPHLDAMTLLWQTQVTSIMSCTKIYYVTQTGTVIVIKLRRLLALTQTVRSDTQVQWPQGSLPH